ncbi:MAG: ankyrin repeat domain-containing protein [Spirochaetes bacterium]|nr:ankyrin repeat domain-containing protein [Spirochaetota bacterium]
MKSTTLIQLLVLSAIPMLGLSGCMNTGRLFTAAREGDYDTVKKIIDDGGDVNSRSAMRIRGSGGEFGTMKLINDRETVLIAAIRSGIPVNANRIRIVNLLIDNGAAINARDSRGRSAMMWAGFTGNLEVARLLLTHGADMKMVDNNGDTVLHFTLRGPVFLQ